MKCHLLFLGDSYDLSVDHLFLYSVLEKFGLDRRFIKWIEVLNYNQESCIFNGSLSTGYFSLERGSRQGDPISAYLFIIVMEVFFIMIRQNSNIKGLNIFNSIFLLTSYANDTTFFVEDLNSADEIFKTFSVFAKFSGLNINKKKCEIAGIGAKRGVHAALSGVKNINLNEQAIKILGVHFSYNEQGFAWIIQSNPVKF